MNALDQYRSLFEANRDMLRANAPAALDRARDRAWQTLCGARLPRLGSEGHAVTDLEAFFAPDYGINLARLPFRTDPAEALRCHVPNISSLMGVVANDTFAPTDGLRRLMPEGVTVCSFARAAELAPGVLEKYYDTTCADSLPRALNTLLAQDGVLVYVRRGVRCNRPVQLLNVAGGAQAPMMALRRVLVVAEEDSDLQLLVCDHADVKAGANASSTVTEIFALDRARVQYYDLEESAPQNTRHATVAARLSAGARLHMTMCTLRCGKTRNDVRVDLDGQGAGCTLNGMAITDGGQRADNNTAVRHNVPACTSTQVFKYVADGQSAGAFEGTIEVCPGAHHTAAHQTNRNMLAAKGARMHTQPHLLIYCDDVKCSHGASTGQISEEQLFYMRSRGIDADTARTMLMQAFMADIIDAIPLEPLRDRLRHLVQQRLDGSHNDCSACHTANLTN